MKIQPVVEGKGEAEAFPVLLRRLQDLSSEWRFSIARPIRQNSSIIRQELNFKKAIQLARIQEDCGGILVLFDLEDDCPAVTTGRLSIRPPLARSLTSNRLPVEVDHSKSLSPVSLRFFLRWDT